MAVRPIPEGYHTVTPSLTVNGAARLIDFLTAAFNGQEIMRMRAPDGKILHAEVKIGDSTVMLNDVMGPSPATVSSLFLYVTDVDATYRRAVGAGAVSRQEPADMFWGDRVAEVNDGFGNHWSIATHFEDIAPHELAARAQMKR